ncbi:hypothetical protein V2I01_30335 [Micromonospora sp. BRA006-A]|nr:hypothetical protein [Micromonospora sp. BRA006-A]
MLHPPVSRGAVVGTLLVVRPFGRTGRRLPGTRLTELVGTVLTGLVAAARRADPGMDWFFDPEDSPPGG